MSHIIFALLGLIDDIQSLFHNNKVISFQDSFKNNKQMFNVNIHMRVHIILFNKQGIIK